MAGKRDWGGGHPGQGLAARVRELMAATEGVSLNELERRARVVGTVARAARVVDQLSPPEDMMDADDDQLDAAGEQRLRDDLLHRILALDGRTEDPTGSGQSGSG
ncbi:hypothetical protein [uncultured Brevundimonas sp.]|uniref:hypothetical protein n=1 Tax=uncultured Brevundimonas sp. TaxID=213418 RepID=UPI0030EC0A90|tara:strand:- start:2613 stop:2927 length:315 start_codon:yes stop_codon:yes gene_type:complete